jgi:hypothetical protein
MMSPEEDDVRETVTALRRILVSYDIHHRRRVECSLVNRYVFGHEVTRRVGGKPKRYRYMGLVHKPGVERVGQSVLRMRDKEAEDFCGHLAKLRVPYRRERIWVEG